MIFKSTSIMKKYTLLLITSLFVFSISFSQKKIKDLDKLSLEYAKNSFEELAEFFSIPNDANYPEQIEPNVKWCEKAFAKRGFKTERLNTETVPLLLASKMNPKAKKTVLVYLQIDGQPVDTAKWFQPDPYMPSLKEKDEKEEWKIIPWEKLKREINNDWRIFSRSASDARGPDMMFLESHGYFK